MIESNGVNISDLFADVGHCRVVGESGVCADSLCYRSDQCSPGSLFFCVPGFVRDGHDFASHAVAQGAVALCVERVLDVSVTQVVVPSVRDAMGAVAARFYGVPSRDLLTVGITGTNGKTTSVFLLAHLLDRAGLRAGVMGTVERRIGGERLPAGRTTPEPLDIQHDLALMRDAGDKAAVMEVSSHALDLGRVLGVRFKAVAFTNLSQDHLDFHHDLESYYAAKRRLFTDDVFRQGHPVAVVNIDDAHGRLLAADCDPATLLTFSVSGRAWEGGPPDLQMSRFETGPDGTEGEVLLRGKALQGIPGQVGLSGAPTEGERRVPFKSRLVGEFNIANALTALGLGIGLGLDIDDMLSALAGFTDIPGRMERVDAGQSFAVLVDYAHTPDSVSNVLRAARAITRGRLIAVLGCGGDRDRTKRPLMGRAAEESADVVVITSDNPRSEEPEAIIKEILTGLVSPGDALVEPDRQLAIRQAVALAAPDDVVLILGKGHESGQEFVWGTIPFDDRLVAKAEIEALSRGVPLSGRREAEGSAQ